MVPGTASPIDVTTRVTACRKAVLNSAPPISVSTPSRSSAAAAVTSAIARRIWDRITPELPRAPRSAPSASAAATAVTSSPASHASACAHAARIVNSMFVPVSASATGKTFSWLISSVWLISSATAACAQRRRVDASSRRADISPPHACGATAAPTWTVAAVGVSLVSGADSSEDRCMQAVDTEHDRAFGDTRDGRYSDQVVGSPGPVPVVGPQY